MAAAVIPMSRNRKHVGGQKDWRYRCLAYLGTLLGEFLEGSTVTKLSEITGALFRHKAAIPGQLALALIEKRHQPLLEQEYCDCPERKRILKKRGMHKRPVETVGGTFEISRPYFYCSHCSLGLYPLDEALGLSRAIKQDEIQSVGVFLANELPYELASETYQRCTGARFSSHHSFHEAVNRAAEEFDILEVCPSKAEVEEKIARIGAGKRWRPIMMLTADGAREPVRPEPSSRKGKRGKGDWKEVKGFRLYLLDDKRIEHVMSWHQMGSCHDLAGALGTIKEAGLIPEEKVRLCVVADGADWIWNRIEELFPTAKQVLDFYHCSEYLHAVAAAQFGKGTEEAMEWVMATLVRLSLGEASDAISELETMKPASAEASKLIVNAIIHLEKHSGGVNYASAGRGGYHIGNGAIESANKMICHGRLKRTGAQWYPSCANNILKLRCSKYNGIFDRVMELHRLHHPVLATRKRKKRGEAEANVLH